MTYYITWEADDLSILTAIDCELDLTRDQLMEAAFAIEGIESGTPFVIHSIIRAADAVVIC